MQSKPGFLTMLLAGGAVCALAGQLHASGLLLPKDDKDAGIAEAEATAGAVKDRTRERPAPASLTSAVKAHGFWFGGNEAAPAKREPIRIERSDLTRKQLKAIATQPGGGAEWVTVDGSVVNVRSGPGLDAPRVGSMTRGTRLRVVERGETWTKVENPQSHLTGWMHQDFLKAAKAPETAG